MHFPKLLFLSLLAALPLGAQTLKPVVTQTPGDLSLLVDAPDSVVDLTDLFALDGVTGPIVRMETNRGLINVELFEEDTPITVQNFLSYTEQGSFDNSIFHRSVPGFVIQGGGFTLPAPPTDSPPAITSLGTISNESGIANKRGTLAMARMEGLGTASSQWYFNLVDNPGLDNPQSPYAVFGRVIGNSILVVDSIAQLTPQNLVNSLGPAFGEIPLINYTGTLVAANYVKASSVRKIPMYPTVGESLSALTFAVSSSNPNLVSAHLEYSDLRLSFANGQVGAATIIVECLDSDGTKVSTSFRVEVNPSPRIVAQPLGRAVLAGGSPTLEVGAESSSTITYQWRRDGQELSGQTGQTLVLSNVEMSDEGSYDVFLTDSAGSVASAPAILTVTNEFGYLTNLSTRSVTSVDSSFVWTTPGFVTRGSGSIDILARAVGPGLEDFGVANSLPDPRISLQMLAEPKTEIKSNDDWETNDNLTELKAATSVVGAFELKEGSRDAAVFTPIPSDAYTANIFSADGTTVGVVLGEIYMVGDPVAGGSALVNLSNRGYVGAGPLVMIGGFAVAGSGPVNLLIRGVGPTLRGFGVSGVLEDPVITVRDKDSVIVGFSDDWESGDLGAALAGIAMSVGAFSLQEESGDAALLLVLDPGTYTVVLSGKSGGTGTGLVEFYLVE
jgi:cyclophilin family peptidyl-prolyl cis-trans isomerase